MKIIESKYKTYKLPGGAVVEVEKAVDTGKAIHYYFTDPSDGKKKRVIKLKR